MQRHTVLLVFGGESSEHEVSISSARNVFAAIDETKFDVLLGYIDRAGKWWLLPRFGSEITTHNAPQLLPALGSESFITLPASKVIHPDVILPILHGRGGEDGSVQALAQLLHIPIVGSDMTASTLAMDKRLSKELLASHEVPVVPYVVHRTGQPLPDFSQLTMKLGSPLFVKPTRGGSSVGVSKIHSEEELVTALGEAHQYGVEVLIEHGVSGRELEVAVLGNVPNHQVSIVGEVVPSDAFYTHHDKYDSTSHAKVIVPADLSPEVAENIRALSGRIYELIGCSGLARIDFLLDDDGTIFFNELNTLPGFTNISMFPKLWREEGIGYPELIERLIESATA